MKKIVSLLAVTAAMAVSAHSAVIGYNFTDLNSSYDTGTPANFTVGSIAYTSLTTTANSISSTSPSTTYTGASGGGNIGGAADTGSTVYVTLTLMPDTGYAITLSDLDFGTRSTTSGATGFSITTSADNFASTLATGTISNTSVWAFKDNTFTPVTGADSTALEVRITLTGGTGSATSTTINSRLDDIAYTVTSDPVAAPEPSTLAGLALGSAFLLARRRRIAGR